MNISSISNLGMGQELNEVKSAFSQESGSPSFANLLEKSITETNDLLQASDKAASDLAIGRSENIHEAMIATEKAETALKLLVQVRNKAIDAYQEIMRMQV